MRKRTAMRDMVIATMSEVYREHYKENVFLEVAFLTTGGNINYNELIRMKTDSDYKVKVKDITPVQQDLVNFVYISPFIEKKKLTSTTRTGMYRVEFEDGTHFIYTIYPGWRDDMHCAIMGPKKTLETLLTNKIEKELKQETPVPGIFQVKTQLAIGYNGKEKAVVQFLPPEWTFSVDPIHPVINKIASDIKYFFDNPKQFSMYGQVPFRKLFAVGPPGTGKSSINFSMARKFSKKITTIFSTNINDIYLTMKVMAKHKKPLLVFYDDAENILSGHLDSALLNFLSGSLTPNNPAGVLILFSSNMTNYIEDRVLKRPGRIDRIFEVGPLKEDHAIACAKMYFEPLYKVIPEDTEIFNDMTGAEIQGLMQYAVVTANFKQKKICRAILKEAKELMKADLNGAKGMMYENSMIVRAEKKSKVGFLKDPEDLPF